MRDFILLLPEFYALQIFIKEQYSKLKMYALGKIINEVRNAQ